MGFENINIYNEAKEKNKELIILIKDFLDRKISIDKIKLFNENLNLSIVEGLVNYSLILENENLKLIASKNIKNEDFIFYFENEKFIIKEEYTEIKITKSELNCNLNLKLYNNLNKFIFSKDFSKYDLRNNDYKTPIEEKLISRLNSYNIDFKKIVLGNKEYLNDVRNTLKEEIEFERLMEDTSLLDLLLTEKDLFNVIDLDKMAFPKKENLSLLEKIKKNFKI